MRWKKEVKEPRGRRWRWKIPIMFAVECRLCNYNIWLERYRAYWSDVLEKYYRPVCKICGETERV